MSTAPHIPIIAHSAWSSEMWKDKALNAEMVEYLQKPVPNRINKSNDRKIHPA
jgi:CheY-like chemotaxis protein